MNNYQQWSTSDIKSILLQRLYKLSLNSNERDTSGCTKGSAKSCRKDSHMCEYETAWDPKSHLAISMAARMAVLVLVMASFSMAQAPSLPRERKAGSKRKKAPAADTAGTGAARPKQRRRRSAAAPPRRPSGGDARVDAAAMQVCIRLLRCTPFFLYVQDMLICVYP